MVLFLIAGVLFSSQDGSVAQASADQKLSGYVLISADGGLVAEARKRTRLPDRAYIETSYPSPRFLRAKWGADRAIVVDQHSGTLGKLRDQSVLLGLFQSLEAKKSGVVEGRDLTEAQWRAAQSLYTAWPRRPGASGPSPRPSGFTIDTDYVVEVTSGGVTRKFSSALPSAKRDARLEALDRIFLEAASRPDLRTIHTEPQDELRMVFIGLGAQKDVVEGSRLAVDLVSEAQTNLLKATTEAAEDVLAAFGLSKTEDELPKPILEDLVDSLRSKPGAYGFPSANEALEFLQNATRFNAQTRLSLRMTSQVRDATTGQPRVGVGYSFFTVPGFWID